MTLLAITCISAAVWRKRTIGAPWETSATAGLIFVAGGELLSSTPGDRLDDWLAAAFHVQHLDDFVGNMCYLAAGLSFLAHALERLTSTLEERRAITKAFIEGPLTLVVALMFACLVLGASCSDRTLLTHSAGAFDWLDAYATVWYIGMAYIAALGAKLFTMLRADGSYLTLDMLIAAAVVGVFACAVRISSFVLDSPELDTAAATCGALSVTLICAATVMSWRDKMRPYRKLLRATQECPHTAVRHGAQRVMRRLVAPPTDPSMRVYGPPL